MFQKFANGERRSQLFETCEIKQCAAPKLSLVVNVTSTDFSCTLMPSVLNDYYRRLLIKQLFCIKMFVKVYSIK